MTIHRLTFCLSVACGLWSAAAQAQSYSFTTLAGIGSYGSEDGPAGSSSFCGPQGVALDGAGNVYVADSGNRTIRKINSAGVVSTLAGKTAVTGAEDGPGSSARFFTPCSIAVDSLGTIYVADTWNFTIRKITPDGEVSTFAGQAGISGSVDGLGNSARFVSPRGLAVDRAGNLHVSDGYTIRTISPGGVVCTVAGSAAALGIADGVGSSARFISPAGVALDSAGNLYVAETVLCVIRKVTPEAVVSTLAGLAYSEGSADGLGSSARFNWPEGVAVDSAGNIYVADTSNNTIRRITPAGMVSTLAGVPGLAGADDGVGSAARFNYPWEIAVDMAGRLYVTDFYNGNIRLGQIVPPALSFNVSANQLILCWPQTASNYVLETSTTLSPTAVWTPVGDPVGTWGDNFVLTNTSGVGARFYRLRVP